LAEIAPDAVVFSTEAPKLRLASSGAYVTLPLPVAVSVALTAVVCTDPEAPTLATAVATLYKSVATEDLYFSDASKACGSAACA
jgi:hypothetical protein